MVQLLTASRQHIKQSILQQDISKLTAEDLETFDASIWLASPACQPYSVLGLQKGAADPRAQSFLHLMHNVLATMVEHGTQPKYLLVENVAGFEVAFLCISGSICSCSPVIKYTNGYCCTLKAT